MTNLSEHCVQIDDAIVVLRRHVQGMDVYNAMMKLGALADLIERHRQLVANEIEGLKSDTRSAEAAYEREKVRADGLAQEQDQWTNVQLPGWRKRVSQAEDALRVMTLDRDEWRQDTTTSEAKLEKALDDLHIKSNHYAELSERFENLRADRHDLAKRLEEAQGGNAAHLIGTKLMQVELQRDEALEAHERTKSNLGRTFEELSAARSRQAVLSDAYDNQKTLTRNALIEARQHVDAFYELKKHAATLELSIAEHAERAKHWEDAYYSAANPKPEDDVVGAEWRGPEFAEVGEEPKGYWDAKPEDVVGMSGANRTAPYLAVDNGEAGGDRTVVTWVCTCGKRKTLTAPKIPLWTYQDHCNCGAITSLNYDD